MVDRQNGYESSVYFINIYNKMYLTVLFVLISGNMWHFWKVPKISPYL